MISYNLFCFSFLKEFEGVKVYFILWFRVVDIFFGKLLDKFGDGKIVVVGI